MRTPKEFDDIRPYDDEELPVVLEELIADEEFRAVVAAVLPDVPFDVVANRMRSCRSKLELQLNVFRPVLLDLIAKQSDGFVLDDRMLSDKGLSYTYITNHRDIVLDSAFLSIGLIANGFGNTVEIAIGDNLLIRPWIKKLVRVNKSFIVERGVGMREMLFSSGRMSRYMHYAVGSKGESVWIAQREGRAKDSDDRTQQSVLKMMTLGGEGNPADRLKALRLVPMALSYEYDPCDYLKAKEFQQKRDNPDFKKSREDDLLNMRTGILGWKGRIVFRMSSCLNSWIDTLPKDMPKVEFYAAVAEEIDGRIHGAYELFPINYVSADLLRGTSAFDKYYTKEEFERAVSYIEERVGMVDLIDVDCDFIRERILEMYANPVFNYIESIG